MKMNPSAVSCISLFIVSLALLSHSADSAPVLRMMTRACRRSNDYKRCLAILVRADPRTLQAKNYRELSKTFLEYATRRATEVQNFIKTNGSPAIAECGGFFYDGTVGSFSSASREVYEDATTANYDAKVAGDGPAGCLSVLATAGVVDPRITVLNNEIALLSSIGFQLTNLIK